ncbi:hypothetical protein [Pseudomonas nitroreducens]|nr:hypothetical protein [Pseudomonas nitroreducens]MCP1651558.1 hypothetical protein [Pseudomonas nitroreducens]MCP1684576.1 hypothetical protein [Pseudomonas nitroreducens]
MDELAETDGLVGTKLGDGAAGLEWQLSEEEGKSAQGEEEELPADFRM